MLLRTGLLEYVSTEWIISKCRIKNCCKSNQEGQQNSLTIMDRATPQQAQVYEIFLKGHRSILNNFIQGAVILSIQGTHWDTPPRSTLQQIPIQNFETIFQSGSKSAQQQLQFFKYVFAFKWLSSYNKNQVNLN